MSSRVGTTSSHLPVSSLLVVWKQKRQTNHEPSEKVADEQAVGERATGKKTALIAANIDDYLEEISELRRKVTIREDLARDAEARRFSLRPADATDKLLRYEAHLDRQLYRAMDQLERFQRQRRGENVPPPININLGRRR